MRLATDTANDERVALKIMLKEWIWKNDMNSVVRREIGIMKGTVTSFVPSTIPFVCYRGCCSQTLARHSLASRTGSLRPPQLKRAPTRLHAAEFLCGMHACLTFCLATMFRLLPALDCFRYHALPIIYHARKCGSNKFASLPFQPPIWPLLSMVSKAASCPPPRPPTPQNWITRVS